jgi:predicted DNA binding protein
MFKQVSLEVKSRNDLLAAAKMNDTKLSIVDCSPLDRERMFMLLDIDGTPAAVKETITTLRKMTGVKEAYGAESDAKGTRVLMLLEKPGVCRASEGAAILCLDCPYNSTEIPARWRFVTKRTSDVGEIITRLREEGIQARIEDISPVDESVTLSQREKGIIAVAIENGYFDFPRKITLEGLGHLVGLEPASLSKILRSVE